MVSYVCNPSNASANQDEGCLFQMDNAQLSECWKMIKERRRGVTRNGNFFVYNKKDAIG